MTEKAPGMPFAATQVVNVFWGNHNYAVQIGTCQANMAIGEAWEWFKENSHFFHLDRFPPYQRFLHFEKYVQVDYGSYTNFLYIIPVNI